MKKIIYTVNIDQYDDIKPLDNNFKEDFEAYLITNNNENIEGWETIKLNNIDDIKSPVYISRHPKIFPQEYLLNNKNEETIFLYIDGNRKVRRSLNDFINNFENYDFVNTNSIIKKNNNLYNEIRACMNHKRNYLKNQEEQLKKLIKLYKTKYLIPPYCFPTVNNSIILRKNTEKIKKLQKTWWYYLINQEICRDQIAFRVSVYMENLKNEIFSMNVDFAKKFFGIERHKK